VSEKDTVLTAIHELELNLTHKIHEHTTALELNNDRLDHLRKAVDRHRELLYGNYGGETTGLISDVKNLKKTETERKWTMRTVMSGIVALLGNFVWDLFHP